MARRGLGGGMTALRAALGAVSGGLEGARIQEAAEAEKKRMADSRQISLANLMSQGFEPVSDVMRKKGEAIGAAGSLIGSALNAASGNAGMPAPSASAQSALASGYAGANPSRTINFDGQELTLRETGAERQERQGSVASAMARVEKENAVRASAEKTAAEEKRLNKLAEDALKGGPKSPAGVKLAIENYSAYKALFDDQSGGISATRRDQKTEDERTAEAWFNTPVADPKERQRNAAIFNNLRKAKPNAPAKELILDAFNAVKAGADLENVRAQTTQRTQAGQPGLLESFLPGAGGVDAPVDQDRYKSDAGYRAWVDSQRK